MEHLKVFATVLVLGPLLDFIWFSLVASDLYRKELGTLLKAKPDLGPAVVVYILIALLVTFFVLPKVGASSYTMAFLWGALAGLIVYGIYDFTNMTFISAWTWKATIADVLWGAFMVGIVTKITLFLQRVLF